MSLLASYWCSTEVGLQVTFEELQGWLSSYERGMRSRQQERHTRSLYWWGMICELVGVGEWWKMNADQVRSGGEWGDGDRVDWISREFDMSWGRFWKWCDYGSVTSAIASGSHSTKGGVKKITFSKFVLYALQGMDQGGRRIVEKGIAVIQARENETACRGRNCVDGEERTDLAVCTNILLVKQTSCRPLQCY